jgi:hypothetical protein
MSPTLYRYTWYFKQVMAGLQGAKMKEWKNAVWRKNTVGTGWERNCRWKLDKIFKDVKRVKAGQKGKRMKMEFWREMGTCDRKGIEAFLWIIFPRAPEYSKILAKFRICRKFQSDQCTSRERCDHRCQCHWQKIFSRCQWHRWIICCRRQWLRLRCTLLCQNFREISNNNCNLAY